MIFPFNRRRRAIELSARRAIALQAVLAQPTTITRVFYQSSGPRRVVCFHPRITIQTGGR